MNSENSPGLGSESSFADLYAGRVMQGIKTSEIMKQSTKFGTDSYMAAI